MWLFPAKRTHVARLCIDKSEYLAMNMWIMSSMNDDTKQVQCLSLGEYPSVIHIN